MLFTVIIPIYKAEEYIEKCVNSVLAQKYTDYEVILVDDGSPDRCPQICDDYAKKDARVRVIHKPNGGLVSARNVGIMAARGDYICYVDADDWAHPNMLQFIHDQLVKSPVPLDMVLFGANNVYADHLEETVNKVPEGYYDRERLEKEVFPRLLVDSQHGSSSGCIQAHTWDKACKRELQVQCYTRDERIRVFTDVPLTYECILNSQHIYICNEKLYYYNKTNEGSIRALSKENLLTKSFYYLVSYMREHMLCLAPTMGPQLNEFAASLIVRTVNGHVGSASSFREAARLLKEGLRESEMLSFVSVKGLPRGPRIVVTLVKLRLYSLTTLLLSIAEKRAIAARQKSAPSA